MKEKPFISFVIYVGASAVSRRPFMAKVHQFADQYFESYELLMVGRADLNLSVPDDVQGRLTLVELAADHDADTAFAAGCDLAIGDFIFEIDASQADYPIELLFELYQKAISGYDIVAAAPKQSHLPLSTRFFYWFLHQVSWLTFDLTTERVRLVTRRALNAVSRVKDKVQHRKILYQFSGFEVFLYPYKPTARIADAKSLRDKLSLGIEILLSFSNLGLRLSFIASGVFFLISIGLGAYALFFYFSKRTHIEGWTTLMLFLSFGFSSLFLVLGLLSQYVVLILHEVKNRPLYTVKSIRRV